MARNNVGRPRGFQLSNYLPTILWSSAERRAGATSRTEPMRFAMRHAREADLSVDGLFHRRRVVTSRRYYQFRALGNVENELRRELASYKLSVWNGLSGSRLRNLYH